MSKVILLSGSPNLNGNTVQVFNEMAKVIKGNGVGAEVISLTDMIVPGSTYWNIVFGQKPGDALNDEEGMSTVKRFAENVAFFINKIWD